MSDLEPEDRKIVTLARATRARLGSAEAAAVRDDTGRTYVAVAVALPSLAVSAIQAALVIAIGSGAERVEAVALVARDAGPSQADVDAVRALGSGPTPIFVADPDGTVRDRVST